MVKKAKETSTTVEEIMKKGADEAAYFARKTLSKVKRKLGFVQL